MTGPRRLSLVAVAAVLFGLAADPAMADADRADPLTIVDRSGDPLEAGGSGTEFRFDLPEAAECPGDSQNGNYRYHSFMIPANQSPSEITYNGLGPEPQAYDSYESFRMPLYDEHTADVTAKLTAEAEQLGGPGPILDLPVLSFHVYGEGDMPLGRYRIGLVCTHLNEPERYWDAVIEVSADASDEPAGIAWRLVGSSPTSSSGSSRPFWIGAGAAALLVVAILASARRTEQKTTSKQERR